LTPVTREILAYFDIQVGCKFTPFCDIWQKKLVHSNLMLGNGEKGKARSKFGAIRLADDKPRERVY
jgi:hypothetical protein